MDGIELKELRKKREKHFLQENGDIIAQVYNEDIHYLKDGEYKEIDNTLVRENNYYKNKENDYQAYFKDRSSNEFMKLVLEDSYFNLVLEDSNNVLPIIDNTSIKYLNIKDGIDFEYLLLPNKVKENIIIQNKESAMQKISFDIKTNLILKIVNNEIHALKDEKTIFTIENPFAIDSNNNRNNDVYYHLVKKELGYQLELVLDKEWFETASYPVVIDPTINTTDEKKDVYDTYIYPGDTNVDRNSQDILKVGVEKVNGKEVVNRALIKFDLPTIGTGSQVIGALLNLIGYGYVVPSQHEIINVHEVTANWSETSANWNTMNDKYNERVEASFESYRSNMTPQDDGSYKLYATINTADITTLVKKWYEDKSNYGIMLKANKEIYRGEEVPAFFSKNNTVSGDSPKPVLVIQYRNQNGLESYMNYQSQGFTEGSTHFNTYNGNLTGVFQIGSTIGGKFPASLSLVYNTNDVVLEKNIGIGLGNQFNLSQTIKETLIGVINYLEYVDGDGTIHYFYEVKDENETILHYQDEDGLNLTIDKTEEEYVLTDKNGNRLKFKIDNGIGYLNEIIDISENKNIIHYDSNHRIIKVEDANNSEINLTYEENKITVVSPNETVVLNYSNNKLISIISKLGTTLFSYNSNNLIETITDINGQKMKYEYYEQSPFRIKMISQYGLNDTLGQYFSVTYGFNSTTLIDNKNRSTIMTYNNLGNLISTSNLKVKNDLKSAYGMTQEYSNEESNEYNSTKNKLLSSGIPVKYVKNYLSNSSFEEEDLGFVTDCTDETVFRISKSLEYPVSGKYCLKAVGGMYGGSCYREVSVPKGHYYTLSAYCCGVGSSSMNVSFDTVSGTDCASVVIDNKEAEPFRYELTFYYSEEATSDLTIFFDFGYGTYYIDDIQLEEGEVANKYNMLDNSDFSSGLDGWSVSAYDRETITENGDFAEINKDQVFEIVDINDLGDKALKIKMNPAQGSNFSKTYQINGKKGETYCINFWYKDEGFKSVGAMDDVRNFVMISYDYVDDGIGDGHCTLLPPPFNPNDNDWQYYSTCFVAEKDFTSLTLSFNQENDANAFYITNLYLYKDVRENYFDYDENGNLKAFYGLDNEKIDYNYDTNNQLIQTVNPNGDKFSYEYDNEITDRVIGGISESGLSNRIKYDSFGNPIVNRITSVGNSLVENTLYLIRAKGTSNYIRCISKSISLNADDCGHDKWSLEKVDERYYRIKYPILGNQYLKVVSNTLSIANVAETADLFKIIKRENGSYYIQVRGKNYQDKLSRNEIEEKYHEAMLRNFTLSEFLNSFVEQDFVSSTRLDEYTKRAIKVGIFAENMLLLTLADWIVEENTQDLKGEKKISKEEIVDFVFDLINDEENPLYVKNNGAIVTLENLIEDDASFEFYFEETDSELFLESSSTYTEDGKFITSTTDTNFNTICYDIDTKTGLVNSVTDAKGNTTSTTYDSKERPVAITNGKKEIHYSYNEQNQLSKISEENKEYNFIYDEFGNRKQVKIGDNITLVTNAYEENNGNLKKITYGNNDEISYTYDDFDRIKTVTKEDTTYHYKYDSNGSLVKILSDNDNILYTYDLSRKLSDYQFNDFKTHYTYDKNNNLINKTLNLGGYKKEIINTYNEEDMLTKTTFDNNEVNYNYDELGRLKNRNIDNQFQTNYEYVTHGNRTSMLIKSIDNNNDKYSSKYDELGNITEVYHNGILEKKYSYDNYNELLEEKDYVSNKKISYTYDISGNLLNKKYYNLTTDDLISQDKYQYNNLDWEDQLSSFNDINITYDEIGNPITIGNNTLEWINGRQLKKYNDIQYKYNVNGIRTSKTVNDIETKYYLEGTKIIFEQKGNNVIYYIRNSIDNLIGFYYNNNKYYYIKNNLDDIIGILDSNYNVVAKYTYDSWGTILSITDSNGLDISNDVSHIANINPFRYRSYYYDTETTLYYLNSRYYNPQWGRFLNADGIIGANRDLLGNNLYAYCSNNPIVNTDVSGQGFFSDLGKKAVDFGKGVVKTAKKVGKAVVDFGKNVVKTAGDIWNGVKNAFVLEVSGGYGFDVNINVATVGGKAGYSKDSTIKVENGKISRGGTTTYGIDIDILGKKAGLSKSYYHENHFVSGDIDKSIIHNYDYASISSIADCEHTIETTTFIFSTEIKKNIDSGVEADDSSIFLGINIGAHLGIGGNFKIGFNIPW